METGKTSRYIKYAVGEILLVVIGILIALQINNWNENRKELSQQTKLIVQLLEDAKIDSVFYASRLTLFNGQLKSYDALLDLCQRGTFTAQDTLSLPSTEGPFQMAANKSNIISNINDYSRIFDMDIKAALRDYNINYSYITTAIELHFNTVWPEFSALIKEFNLASMERNDLSLSQFFPVCGDANIQGRITLCKGSTFNAREQALRFIGGNTQMIEACRRYLNQLKE